MPESLELDYSVDEGFDADQDPAFLAAKSGIEQAYTGAISSASNTYDQALENAASARGSSLSTAQTNYNAAIVSANNRVRAIENRGVSVDMAALTQQLNIASSEWKEFVSDTNEQFETELQTRRSGLHSQANEDKQTARDLVVATLGEVTVAARQAIIDSRLPIDQQLESDIRDLRIDIADRRKIAFESDAALALLKNYVVAKREYEIGGVIKRLDQFLNAGEAAGLRHKLDHKNMADFEIAKGRAERTYALELVSAQQARDASLRLATHQYIMDLANARASAVSDWVTTFSTTTPSIDLHHQASQDWLAETLAKETAQYQFDSDKSEAAATLETKSREAIYDEIIATVRARADFQGDYADARVAFYKGYLNGKISSKVHEIEKKWRKFEDRTIAQYGIDRESEVLDSNRSHDLKQPALVANAEIAKRNILMTSRIGLPGGYARGRCWNQCPSQGTPITHRTVVSR